MNNDSERQSLIEIAKPVFSWFPIVIHFSLANLLAWVVISLPNYNETIQPFVNLIASIIPSVAGMGEMSPNFQWGELYFLLCFAGSPLYMRFFWRFSAYALPVWVKEQPSVKFWLSMFGLMLGAVGSLYFLKPSRHSYTSVRAPDFIDMLIKESYLAYGLMALLLVITFSFMLSVPAKSIQLRIANQRGTKDDMPN